jgi:Arc/MetJ-type ribon-helix-helix transcriptional regulator
VKKVSITLEDEVEAGVRERVGEREFSPYVNAAVRRSLQADRLTELLRKLEVEHGPIPPDVQAEIDAEDWPR